MRAPIPFLVTVTLSFAIAGGCSEPVSPIPASGDRAEGERPPRVVPPAAPSSYAIYLANAAGEDLRLLAHGIRPTWSPDGSRIAFERPNGSGIHVIAVDGQMHREVRGGESWLPRWSADGSRISFGTFIPNRDNGPMPMGDVAFGVMNSDGSGETLLGEFEFSGTIPPAEWSPDGRKVALVSGARDGADLRVINVDGSGTARLTRLGTVAGADWSPDGRRLAFHARGSVYVIDADGSNLKRLTRDADSLVVRHLEWSPRGDRIAFTLTLDPLVWEVLYHPRSSTLHVIDADGSNRMLLATDAADPRWLPGGRSLSFRTASDEIWTVAANGGEPSRLLRNAVGAEWSPDGTLIAYVR